jgi:hypothetical protein
VKHKAASRAVIERLAARVRSGELTFKQAKHELHQEELRARKRAKQRGSSRHDDALDHRLPGSFESGKRR